MFRSVSDIEIDDSHLKAGLKKGRPHTHTIYFIRCPTSVQRRDPVVSPLSGRSPVGLGVT